MEAIKAYDEPINYYKGNIEGLKNNFLRITSNQPKYISDSISGVLSDGTYSVSKNIVLDGSSFNDKAVAKLINKPVQREVDSGIFGMFGKHEYHEERGMEIHMNGMPDKKANEVGKADKGRGYKLLDRMPSAVRRSMSPPPLENMDSMLPYDTYLNTGYKSSQVEVYTTNTIGKDVINFIRAQEDNSLTGMFYEWRNTGATAGMKNLESKFSEIIIPEKFSHSAIVGGKVKTIFNDLPNIKYSPEAFTHIHSKTIWTKDTVVISTGNFHTLYKQSKGDMGWGWYDKLKDAITPGDSTKNPAQQNFAIKIKDTQAALQMNRVKDILMSKGKNAEGTGYLGLTSAELASVYKGVDPGKRLIFGGSGTNSLATITGHLNVVKQELRKQGKQGTIYVTGPYISDMGNNQFVDMVASLARQGHNVRYIAQHPNSKEAGGSRDGSINTITKLQQAGVTVLVPGDLNGSYLAHFKGFYSLEGSVLTSHNQGGASDKSVFEVGGAIYDKDINKQFVSDLARLERDNKLIEITELPKHQSWFSRSVGRVSAALGGFTKGWEDAETKIEHITKPISYAMRGLISGRDYNLKIKDTITNVERNISNPELRAAALGGYGITLPSKMNPSYYYAKAVYNRKMHDANFGEYSIDRYTRGAAASLYIHSYTAKNGTTPGNIPDSIKRFDQETQAGGLGTALNVWGIENGYGRIMREELGVIGSVGALVGRMLDQSMSFYTQEMHDPYYYLDQLDGNEFGFQKDPKEGVLEGALGHAGKMLQGALYSAMVYVSIGEPINLFISHLFKSSVESDLTAALAKDAGLKLKALAHASGPKNTAFFGLDNPFNNMSLTLNHLFLRKRGAHLLENLVIPFLHNIVNPYTNHNDRKAYLRMAYKITGEIAAAPDIKINNLAEFDIDTFKSAMGDLNTDLNVGGKVYSALTPIYNKKTITTYDDLIDYYQELDEKEKAAFNDRMGAVSKNIEFEIEGLGVSRQMNIARSLQDILDETPLAPWNWGAVRRFFGQPTFDRPADGGFNAKFFSVGNVLSFEDITRNIETLLNGRGGFNKLIAKYHYISNAEALANSINKLDSIDLNADDNTSQSFQRKLWGKLVQTGHLITGIADSTADGFSKNTATRRLIRSTGQKLNRAEANLGPKRHLVTGYTYLQETLGVSVDEVYNYFTNPTKQNAPTKQSLLDELNRMQLGGRRILSFEDSAYDILEATQQQTMDLLRAAEKQVPSHITNPLDRQRWISEKLQSNIQDIYNVVSVTDAKKISKEYVMNPAEFKRKLKRDQYIKGLSYKEFRGIAYNGVATLIAASFIAKQLFSGNEGVGASASLLTSMRTSMDFAKVGDHTTELNVNRLGLLEGIGNLLEHNINKFRPENAPPLNLWGITLGDASIYAGMVGQLVLGYKIAVAMEGFENRKYVLNITKQHNYFKEAGGADSPLVKALNIVANRSNKVMEGSLIEQIGKNRITIMSPDILDDTDRLIYNELATVHLNAGNIVEEGKTINALEAAQNIFKEKRAALVQAMQDAGIANADEIGEVVPHGLNDELENRLGKNKLVEEYVDSMNVLRKAAIDYDGIIAININRAGKGVTKGVNMVFTRAGLDTFNVSGFATKGGTIGRTILTTAGIMLGASLITSVIAKGAAASRELTGSFDPFVGGLSFMAAGAIGGRLGLFGRSTGRFPTALKVGKGAGLGLLLGIVAGTGSALFYEGGIFRTNKATKASNAQMVGLATNLESFSYIVLLRYHQGDPTITKQELTAALYAKFISSSISLSEGQQKNNVSSKALQSPFHFIQFFVAQRKEEVYYNGVAVTKRTYSAGMQGPPISGLSFSFMLPFVKYNYVDSSEANGNKLGVYGTGYMANSEYDIGDLYETGYHVGGYILTFGVTAKITEEAFRALKWSDTNHISDFSFKIGKGYLDGITNVTTGVVNIATFLVGANYRYIEDIRRSMANNLDTNFARHMSRNRAGRLLEGNKRLTIGLLGVGAALGFLMGLSNEQLLNSTTGEYFTNPEARWSSAKAAITGAVIGAGVLGGSYFTQSAIINHFNDLDSTVPKSPAAYKTQQMTIGLVNTANKVSNFMGSKYGSAIGFSALFGATVLGFHAMISSDFGLYQDFDSTWTEHLAVAGIAATLSTFTGAAITSGFGGSVMDRAIKQANHLQYADAATGTIKRVYHKFQAFRYRDAGTDLGSLLDRKAEGINRDVKRIENDIDILEKRLTATKSSQSETRLLIETRIQGLREQLAGFNALHSLDNLVRYTDAFSGSVLDNHKAVNSMVSHVVTLSADQFAALDQFKTAGSPIHMVEITEAAEQNTFGPKSYKTTAARNAAAGANPNRLVRLDLNLYNLMDGSMQEVLRPIAGDLYVDLGIRSVSRQIKQFGKMSLTKSVVKALAAPVGGFFTLGLLGRAFLNGVANDRLKDLELYQRDSWVSQVSSDLITLFTGADRKMHRIGEAQAWVENNELQMEEMTYHSLSPALAKANMQPISKKMINMFQEGLVLDDTNVFMSFGVFGVTASNKESGDVFRAYVQVQGAGADVSATAYAFSASFMFKAILSDAQQLAFIVQGISKEVGKDMTSAQVKQVSMRILAVSGNLPPLKKHRQFSTGLEDQLRTATGGKLVNMAIQERLAETRRLNKLNIHAIFANTFRQAVYQQGGDIETMLAMMLASSGDKNLTKDFWQILMSIPGARPLSTNVMQLGVSNKGQTFGITRQKKVTEQLDVFYEGNYSIALQYKEQTEMRNFLSGVFTYFSETIGTLTGTSAIVAGLATAAVTVVGVTTAFLNIGSHLNYVDNDIRLNIIDSYYNDSWFYSKSNKQSKWEINSKKIENNVNTFAIKKGKDVFVLELPKGVEKPGQVINSKMRILAQDLDRLVSGIDYTGGDSIYTVYQRIKGVFNLATGSPPNTTPSSLTSTLNTWLEDNKGETNPLKRKAFKADLSIKIKEYLLGDGGIKSVLNKYVDTIFNQKIDVPLKGGGTLKVSMGLLHPQSVATINSLIDEYESALDAGGNKTTLQANLESKIQLAENNQRGVFQNRLNDIAEENIDDILKSAIDDRVITKGGLGINIVGVAPADLGVTASALGTKIMHGLMMDDNSIFSIVRHGWGRIFGVESTDSVGLRKQLNKDTIGRLSQSDGVATSEEAVIRNLDEATIAADKAITDSVTKALTQGTTGVDKFGKGAFKTVEILGDITDVFEIMGFFGNLQRLNSAAKHGRISESELRSYSYDMGYSTTGLGITIAATAMFTKLMMLAGSLTFWPALLVGTVAIAAVAGVWHLIPPAARENLMMGAGKNPVGKAIGASYKWVSKGIGEVYYHLYNTVPKVPKIGGFLTDIMTLGILGIGTYGLLKASKNAFVGVASKVGEKLGIGWLAGIGMSTVAYLAAKNIVNPEAPAIPGFLYNATEAVLKSIKDMPLIGYGYVEGYAALVEDTADYGPLERKSIKQKLDELDSEQKQLLEDIDGSQTLAYLMGDVFGRKTNMLEMESAYARGMVSSPRAQVSPQIRREMELRGKLYAQSTFGEIAWRMRVENSKNAAAVLEKEASYFRSKVNRDLQSYVQTTDKVAKAVTFKAIPGKKTKSGKSSIVNHDNVADALLDFITTTAQPVLANLDKKVNVTGVVDNVKDRVILVGTGVVNTAASYFNLDNEGEINIAQDGHELYTMLNIV
jgi:hypothetical protein